MRARRTLAAFGTLGAIAALACCEQVLDLRPGTLRAGGGGAGGTMATDSSGALGPPPCFTPPPGWKGPIVIAPADGKGGPLCTDGWQPSALLAGASAPKPGPVAACACTCGDPKGGMCASSTSGIGCFDAGDGTCKCGGSGQILQSGCVQFPGEQSASISPPASSPGSCSPTATRPPTSALWTAMIACESADACAPPPAGFPAARCVYQAFTGNDAPACPAGYDKAQTAIFTQIDDARSCGDGCSCGSPDGFQCGFTGNYYSDSNAQDGGCKNLVLQIPSDGGCRSIPPYQTVEFAWVSKPGSCAPSGASTLRASGLTFAAEYQVCCSD